MLFRAGLEYRNKVFCRIDTKSAPSSIVDFAYTNIRAKSKLRELLVHITGTGDQDVQNPKASYPINSSFEPNRASNNL